MLREDLRPPKEAPIGFVKVEEIKKHKRLRSFDEKDFYILRTIVSQGASLAISPNVVSETSNLARQTNNPLKNQISTALRVHIEKAHEIYVESANAVSDPDYLRLGVTDSVLLQALSLHSDLLLLTTDHNLHIAAAYRHLNTLNFNHVRDQRQDFY